jgi:hypothetical protein
VCTIWEGAPPYWGPSSDIVPTNGFFTYGDPTWFRNGVAVELAEDVELGARIGMPTYKPVQPLRPGDELTFWDDWCEPACSYCESDCEGMLLTIGPADITAPTKPELTVHTRLVRDPASPGAWSCGDADSLEIQVTVTDDMSPIRDIGMVAYVAPTLAELPAMTTPTHAIGLGYDAAGSFAIIEIGLGEASGHIRGGSDPFTSPDPFCFSLAAFDAAGNLSERSDPVCVETDNENDPSVVWVESTGCGCQSTAAGPSSLLLVAIVALVIRGTGRARRPGN